MHINLTSLHFITFKSHVIFITKRHLLRVGTERNRYQEEFSYLLKKFFFLMPASWPSVFDARAALLAEKSI